MIEIEKKCRELLIKSLRPIPQELNEIDWKINLTPKTERLKKHLSAFANLQGGGFLLFGVNDNGSIVGISDKDSREIADILANLARTALEPQINIHYTTFNMDGKAILGVYIEESFEKPVHIKGKSIENSFIRAGGQSRQMSKEELRRSIMTSGMYRFSELPAALHINILNDWENYFDFSEVLKRTHAQHFTDKNSFYQFLISHKLLTHGNHQLVPTNLCVQSCSKDFYLFPTYENFSIRMIEYDGIDKSSAKQDISFREGYSIGLEKVISTLISWLPYKEKPNSAHEKIPMIPEISLREIISNAVIHRDYTQKDSSILVELYRNRVEVTNPGGLMPEIPVDRLIDHPSRTRNEVLADHMRRLNFSEERGSGIDKAIIASEVYGLPPIRFIDGKDYFKVVLFARKQLKSLSKEQQIETIFQHTCLNMVLQRRTTAQTISDRFKSPKRELGKILKIIQEAIDAKKIKIGNPGTHRKDHYYLPYWA